MRHRQSRLTPLFTQYAVFTFPRLRVLKLVWLTADRAAAEEDFRFADWYCPWVCLVHRPSLMETAGMNNRSAELIRDGRFWEAVR